MVKEKILIVEDSESLITYYKGILASLKIKIDTAKSFDDAISKLKENDYCFHIIDISLDGDEPGLDIIGKCGADPSSCLVLSSTITEKVVLDLVEIYGVPRELIMTKPVEAKILIDLITERLNNKLLKSQDITTNNLNVSGINLEKLIIKQLWDYICDRKIATIAFIVVATVFMKFFISYLKIDAYNEIQHKIETYNEYRFRHYNTGTSISETTFVNFSGYALSELFEQLEREYPDLMKNKSSKLNLMNSYVKDHKDFIKRIQIKFYSDNNYLIIITDSDNTIRQVWIPDRKYLNELGVGNQMSFVDIFLKTWRTTFK